MENSSIFLEIYFLSGLFGLFFPLFFLSSLQYAESSYFHDKNYRYCKWNHNLLLGQVSYSDLVP